MRFTNTYGLPPNIVHALTADEYTREGTDFSATELISPPQMIHLIKQNYNEIEVDVSERFWLLMGNAVHNYLEKHGKHGVVEQRIFKEFSIKEDMCGEEKEFRYVVSGKADLYDGESLTVEDYKTTSVWSYILGTKPEWEAQLNIYGLLNMIEGNRVEHLLIRAILRDWNKRESTINPDYPKIPFVSINIPLWDWPDTHTYIQERIKLHHMAREYGFYGKCSPHEKWQKPDSYAVMKDAKAKRALRVFTDEVAATSFAVASGGVIVRRIGERKRCESYCLASAFCGQKREEDAAAAAYNDENSVR